SKTTAAVLPQHSIGCCLSTAPVIGQVQPLLFLKSLVRLLGATGQGAVLYRRQLREQRLGVQSWGQGMF
ncbi:MAG: hypothetical protein ACQKBV_05990, partial [Puniceicoccales bacterium]